MSTTFIYALCDPRTLEVRYVGKSDDPYRRYCAHLIDKFPSFKVSWIVSLLKVGLNPILQILEQCDESIWQQREKDWISFEKRIGCNLTNGTEGGGWNGRSSNSAETRAKIGAAHRGKIPWNKGKPMSEEQKKKLSRAKVGTPAWNKGKHPSDETRRKLSDARKAMKGKLGHLSGETKRKLSEANKGKHDYLKTIPRSPSCWKGKHLSEDHKNKIQLSSIGKHPQARRVAA